MTSHEAKHVLTDMGAGEVARESTPALGSLREGLLAVGWSQGSILPPELHAHVEPHPFALWPETSCDGYEFVIISQSCDIVHESTESEPCIEIAVLRPQSAPNGQHLLLRNPRRFHLSVHRFDGGGCEVWMEAAAAERGYLSRERLRETAPHPELVLTEQSMWQLPAFFARRYVRSALPEEFSKRFEPAQKPLRKWLEKNAQYIFDLRVRVRDPETPATDAPLECTFYVVLNEEWYAEQGAIKRGVVNGMRSELTMALKRASSVVVEDLIMFPPSLVTLNQVIESHTLTADG